MLSTQDQPHISLLLFCALLWLNAAAPTPHMTILKMKNPTAKTVEYAATVSAR